MRRKKKELDFLRNQAIDALMLGHSPIYNEKEEVKFHDKTSQKAYRRLQGFKQDTRDLFMMVKPTNETACQTLVDLCKMAQWLEFVEGLFWLTGLHGDTREEWLNERVRTPVQPLTVHA